MLTHKKLYNAQHSLIFRPIMDISVDENPAPAVVQYTNYTISLKNIGSVPTTHLRLTMAYPNAKILGTVIEYEDENMMVRNESEGNSVVAFLPRLASAASISINVEILIPIKYI